MRAAPGTRVARPRISPRRLGFSAAEIGRLGIVVTEAATNLVKHGGGGELLLRTLGSDGTRGVGAARARSRARDSANLAEAHAGRILERRDTRARVSAPSGDSRPCSTSTRCPAPGRRSWPRCGPARRRRRAPGPLASGINVRLPGRARVGRCLGARDGARAHRSSSCPTASVTARSRPPPRKPRWRSSASGDDSAAGGDSRARPRRACARRVAPPSRSRRSTAGAASSASPGIGNIAGTILADGRTWSLVSHHGTAGHDVRRIQEFTYPWPAGRDARAALRRPHLALDVRPLSGARGPPSDAGRRHPVPGFSPRPGRHDRRRAPGGARDAARSCKVAIR